MSANFYFELVAMPLAVLLSLAFFMELGVRLRKRHHEADPSSDQDGLGVVDGAAFGLMGLLLAFAFSGAAGRFDDRRELIVQEANDIGTAWLRIDLLPPEAQPAIRQKFRDYVDSRLETYQDMGDERTVRVGLAKSGQLQNDIWALATEAAAKSPTTMAGMLLLPSLNDMFDITTERAGRMLMHPPLAVFILLIAVLSVCAVLAGYRMGTSARWSTLHRVSFVLILSITYYVIVDLEYPRVGLLRVDSFDQFLVQVRATMN